MVTWFKLLVLDLHAYCVFVRNHNFDALFNGSSLGSGLKDLMGLLRRRATASPLFGHVERWPRLAEILHLQLSNYGLQYHKESLGTCFGN